ncbi:PnbA Carboxylesterase type B [Pyrenophora tritici-repentis]|nr:PnbA Carboxylesterase type B [Pyrenophora tritici-repentis]KAI0610650.1 PnbA Carboxylesterase type B [Pyrenophora tritici-repentis]KAI0619933.1 PnbA Carboxylesterase type B [Pyrenophora tritici-repentis]
MFPPDNVAPALHESIVPSLQSYVGAMGHSNMVQRVISTLAVVATSFSGVTATYGTSAVTLPGYGSFVGTTVSQTLTKKPLPAPVDAWLGIDYASQPTGEGRFAPVGPPEPFSGMENASQYGFSCYQDPLDITYEMDEACLSMNVFRPQGVKAGEKLPVLVWIHGGGFVAGSSRSFDGASFVANSKQRLITVTFNYRVNSLGFLPHPVFERLGLLNLGLRDQETLLKFVQQYISSFGGDPTRVTIGGRSAGAHSVGIHLFHNYEKSEGPAPLFSQALLQSGSVTARSFPDSSYPLYQEQFSRYLGLTGCSAVANSTDTKIISCLRAAPIDKVQNASAIVWRESEYAITWPFQPTRGGPLLEQSGSLSGQNKQFYRIPTITTNVPDEAKYYTSGNLTKNAEFLAFMKNLIPGLTPDDLSDLETLYPDPASDINGPYAHSPNSTQYNRISAALTDYMYVCAGQETAIRMSSAGVPVYKLVFAVNNTFPAWKGIPHTADTKYTWAEPSGAGGVQYPDVGKELLNAYFSDFVALGGDPNKGNRTGVPVWPRYVQGEIPGLQLRMEPFGNSRVEGDGIRRKMCEWWRSEERAGRLEK